MNHTKEYKECQYCAEHIRNGAVLCKHCNKKQLTWEYPKLLVATYMAFEYALIFFYIGLVLASLYDGDSEYVDQIVKKTTFLYAGLFCAGILLAIWQQSCKKSGSKIIRRKLSPEETRSTFRDYYSILKRMKWYTILVAFIIPSIILLKINRPTERDHKAYIEKNTEFISAEIVKYKEWPIVSLTAVSEGENDVIFLGIGGNIFQIENR